MDPFKFSEEYATLARFLVSDLESRGFGSNLALELAKVGLECYYRDVYNAKDRAANKESGEEGGQEEVSSQESSKIRLPDETSTGKETVDKEGGKTPYIRPEWTCYCGHRNSDAFDRCQTCHTYRYESLVRRGL